MHWISFLIIFYYVDQIISLSIENILSDEKYGRNVGNNPETMGKGSSQAMDIGTGKGGGDKYQAPNYTQYTNQDFKGFMPNYQSMVGMSKPSNESSGNNATQGAGSFGNFLDLKSMMAGFMEMQKLQAKADALKAQLTKNATKSDAIDTSLINDDVEVIAKKRESWPGPHGSVSINKIPMGFSGNSAKIPKVHGTVKINKIPMDFTGNAEKPSIQEVHGNVKINKIPMGPPEGEELHQWGKNMGQQPLSFFVQSKTEDAQIFPSNTFEVFNSFPVYAVILVSWRNGEFTIEPLGWISRENAGIDRNLDIERRDLIESTNLLLVKLHFGENRICPTRQTYLFASKMVIVPQNTTICPVQKNENGKFTRKLGENASFEFLMMELEKEINEKIQKIVDKDNDTKAIGQQIRDVGISFDQSGSKMDLEDISAGGGGEKGKHEGGGISVKIGVVENNDDKNVVRSKRQNMMNLFFTW